MGDTFPIEHQIAHNWCWAAVAVSVHHYLSPDTNLRQCELASRLLNHDPRCCEDPVPDDLDRPQQLDDALTAAKIVNHPKPPLNFREIREQIDAGLPVCARIGWIGQNSGHAVVICGCPVSANGEQWVDIADPFFPNSTIRLDEFSNSYEGAGEWAESFLVEEM